MSTSASSVSIRYAVPRWSPDWAIPEVPVPESEVHDHAIEYMRSVLLAWAERSERNVRVLRNIGIRWVREEPRAGFDPDLCLLDPAPDFEEGLDSLRLWRPELSIPRLAIEVVSPGHPYKDYVDTPERAAACGIRELWIYDPLLVGPKKHGGPFLLQVWHAIDRGYERLGAGDGPLRSPELNAWLHPVATRVPSQACVHSSDDVEGAKRWPTLEQQHLDASEQRHLDAEQKLAQRTEQVHAAEARARAAEAELARLRADRDG